MSSLGHIQTGLSKWHYKNNKVPYCWSINHNVKNLEFATPSTSYFCILAFKRLNNKSTHVFILDKTFQIYMFYHIQGVNIEKKNLQIVKPNLTFHIFHTLYDLERKNLNFGKSTCYKNNIGAIMLIGAKSNCNHCLIMCFLQQKIK
jgi:hypothetical protein